MKNGFACELERILLSGNFSRSLLAFGCAISDIYLIQCVHKGAQRILKLGRNGERLLARFDRRRVY